MKNQKDLPMALYWILPIGIIIIWLISGVCVFKKLNTWSERGTFGDMFGAINSLFSGLAFAGLIIAIFLQRKELQLQREELEETRQELARSADAHENNLKILEKNHQESLKQSVLAHTQNTKIDALNTMIYAYTTMLDPKSGIKDRNIEQYDLNAENIKKKFLKTLEELEKYSKGN